jgi:L-ribulose-5-phosphate 4-epimerase
MLEKLCQTVCQLHAELPTNHLVAWTSGNISARDPETNLVVIKPSGVKFPDLRPENMVVVNLNGDIVEGNYKASSDTASHCYIYRHMPQVNGIVHTHSRFATAFATHGRSIPCITTAMGDEFGGDIPCGGFALIGGQEIGQIVVETLRGSRNGRKSRQSGRHDRRQRGHRLGFAAHGHTAHPCPKRHRQAVRPLPKCLWAVSNKSQAAGGQWPN